MTDAELSSLLAQIQRLETEQEDLKKQLNELSHEQSQDHEIIISVQQQLNTLYQELDRMRKTIFTKIEESNNIILEQNKLMMEHSQANSDKNFKLIIILVMALLTIVGVKAIDFLHFL